MQCFNFKLNVTIFIFCMTWLYFWKSQFQCTKCNIWKRNNCGLPEDSECVEWKIERL